MVQANRERGSLMDLLPDRVQRSIGRRRRSMVEEIPLQVQEFIQQQGFCGNIEPFTVGYQDGKFAARVGDVVIKSSDEGTTTTQREIEGYNWKDRHYLPFPNVIAEGSNILALPYIPRLIDIREAAELKLIGKRRLRQAFHQTFSQNVDAWESPEATSSQSTEFFSMQRKERHDTQTKLFFGTNEQTAILAQEEMALGLPQGSLVRSKIEYKARNHKTGKMEWRRLPSVWEGWRIVSQLYDMTEDQFPTSEIAVGNEDLSLKNGNYQRRERIPILLKKAIHYLDLEMFGRFHIPEAIAALFRMRSLNAVKIKSPIKAQYRHEDDGTEVIRITNLNISIPRLIKNFHQYSWRVLPLLQKQIEERGFHVENLEEQVRLYAAGKDYYEAAYAKKRKQDPGSAIIPIIWAGENILEAMDCKDSRQGNN